MSENATPPPRRPFGWIAAVVGAFGLAGSIALFNLSMAPVLELGGRCASGGPYVIASECPDTVWVTFVSVGTGLVSLGLLAGGTARLNGPRLVWLAWPGLFLSLAWTLWSHGRSTDQVGSALPMVVLFVLMGAPVAVGALWFGARWFVGEPEEPWRPPAPVTLATAAPPAPPTRGTRSGPISLVVPTSPQERQP